MTLSCIFARLYSPKLDFSLPLIAAVNCCESVGDGPPLCLILKRDPSYLYSCCALHQGKLVVRAYPGGRLAAQQFRNGIEAEVIGKVTAIVRRLL